jgi:sugar phosphate isomerase/epimerase
MTIDRRKFLLTTGMLASGAALASLGCKSQKTATKSNTALSISEGQNASLSSFGIQLYTLRTDLPKDPKGVLKNLSSYGYKQVESFEGAQGMFWGMTNKEFKAYMDSLGMTIITSHCDIKKDFERKAAESGEIGMKYLICPSIGPQKSIDDFKRFSDNFNNAGEICKKNGMRFAYHNHGYSFQPVDGQIPQDVLMQNTNPDLVDFEMDIYWVITGGADPEAWFKKYPNRFRLCHVKDRGKQFDAKETEASVDLGTGSIEFAKILKTGKSNGLQYYIVEQERYDNSTPLKSAAADADYMKKLVF